jgi:hypothetical protein
MLTKRSRSTTHAQARAPQALARPFRHPAALRRAALSVALSAALLSPTLLFGGGTRSAAAQAQPGFDVDAEATAQVQRISVQPTAATADFSSLSAALAGGGAASASASSFVEPPPAPPEPGAAAEAPAVSKSMTRGKSPDKQRLAAEAAADKSPAGVSSSPPDAGALSGSTGFLAQADPGLVAPPDTQGAVGPARVLSATRAGYVVQDKETGAVLSSVPIEVFWAPTGATTPYGPRALYDPYNDRWLLAAASDPRSPASSVLVAVSQTGDPAGAYHLYRFDADSTDQLWADCDSLGFNKNWLVVSFNAHNISDNQFNQGRVLALDYAAARAGTAAATLFGGISNVNGGVAMQPAVTYSQTEEMQYLVSHISSGGATYRVSAITGTPSNPTLFIGVQKTNGLGPWSDPRGEVLPQAPPAGGGAARKIENSDARVQKAVFRNGSIYFCQTVGLPAGRAIGAVDRTAAQWVQANSQADFVAGGRAEDPGATPTNGGKWYAFPSMSVNRFGDVLLGLNQFSSAQHPAAAYATHVAGDPAGSIRGPVVYKAGEGYYEKTINANRNLWGLYSGAQVDNVNDRDIWTIQEYAQPPAGVGPTSGRWGTWWARVPLPNRPPSVAVTAPPDGSIYIEPANIQFTATASDMETHVVSVEFFSGPSKIGDGVETSPGTWSFTWQNVPAGTYPIRARATDSEGGSSAFSAPITVTVRPVASLSDDFNDNSTDTSKWTVVLPPNMTVIEQNQRLEITTPSSGVGYGGYHANFGFNLTNRRATVEVVQAARGHGLDTFFVLHDRNTDRNSYLFAVGGVPGTMLMRETVNGVITSQTTITYDPVQHRFWRIRHDPATDTVLWETSADGLQWTARHTAPRRFIVNNMQARLYAGRFTTTTTPQVAIFDNYRVEDNPPSRVLLADNFDDNSRDPAKWTMLDPSNSVATAHERNQRLEVAPSPSQVGYNGFVSANTYDFTNAWAAVEVVQATNPFNPETHLQLYLDDANNVITVVSGGNIIFQYSVGGVRSRTFVPYSPTAHRFWRIRHDIATDNVIWETSADGVSWTAQRTAPRPIPLTSVRVRLIAGKWTNTSSTNPGTAIYDNFRAEREPFEPPTDNFNDNSLDPARWQIMENSPVTVREQNQRLEIALVPNTAAYNGVVSVPTVDFYNKTVQVEMVQTVSFAGWAENYLELRRDGNNSFYFAVGGQGTFVCDARTNGVLDRTQVWYDAVQYRFWRLRHNGPANTMNFEVSPNGQTWTTLKTVAVGFPLDSMKVRLFAGAWGTGNSAPGTAVYDGLKLTPNE